MDGNVEDYDFPWTLPDTDEDIQKYIVSLYCATGGVTDGSGVYQEGSMAFCHAYPADAYVFDRWVGDFHGEDADIFTRVYSDISSTAYFRKLLEPGPVRPCYDSHRKIYNPLIDMIIAPTDSSKTNYIGSTFGYTRSGGTKEHKGLDLYAPEGTPVYAMYDGIISKKQRFVTSQPNRNDEEWPVDYNEDKNGAGNRFSIECELGGETIYFVYWHMMSETPLAINPRTGENFKPGDEVFAGEIVGYTGRTGNAYNVDYYHLHLGVMDKDDFLNPEDFINGKLQWDNNLKSSLTNMEIVNIRCDEQN